MMTKAERKTMECPTCGHTAVLWATFVYSKSEEGKLLGTFRRTCWECAACVREGRPTYYHTEEQLDIPVEVLESTRHQKRQTAKVSVPAELARPEVTEAKPKTEVEQ
jgi:ribosomal protein S27AE